MPKTAGAKKAVAKKFEKTTRKSTGLYDVHPGVAMMQKWIGELKEKTGRSVEKWIELTKKEGPASGHKARVEWLKKKHKMGNNSAWWIAERAGGKRWDEDSPEAYLATAEKYVEEQYAGKKEQLRPLYEELLKLGKSVADDVSTPITIG